MPSHSSTFLNDSDLLRNSGSNTNVTRIVTELEEAWSNWISLNVRHARINWDTRAWYVNQWTCSTDCKTAISWQIHYTPPAFRAPQSGFRLLTVMSAYQLNDRKWDLQYEAYHDALIHFLSSAKSVRLIRFVNICYTYGEVVIGAWAKLSLDFTKNEWLSQFLWIRLGIRIFSYVEHNN